MLLPHFFGAGRLLFGGVVFGCESFGGVVGFDGALVRQAGLLVGAEMIVHAVGSGCGFVGMGRETVNLGSVDRVCHGHSLFLWVVGCRKQRRGDRGGRRVNGKGATSFEVAPWLLRSDGA